MKDRKNTPVYADDKLWDGVEKYRHHSGHRYFKEAYTDLLEQGLLYPANDVEYSKTEMNGRVRKNINTTKELFYDVDRKVRKHHDLTYGEAVRETIYRGLIAMKEKGEFKF